MSIDPDLLRTAGLPERRSRAAARGRRCSSSARSARRASAIDDGIPVLLLDEATPGPNGLGNRAEG